MCRHCKGTFTDAEFAKHDCLNFRLEGEGNINLSDVKLRIQLTIGELKHILFWSHLLNQGYEGATDPEFKDLVKKLGTKLGQKYKQIVMNNIKEKKRIKEGE
jgi:hypothetical protein